MWMIVGWTTAIIISGVIIELWIAGLWPEANCFKSEDEIACAGAEAFIRLYRWFLEGLFIVAWFGIWYGGFAAIDTLAEKHDARKQLG